MLLGSQAKKIAATMISGEKKEPFVQELGQESGEGRPSFEKTSEETPDSMTDMDAGLSSAAEQLMSAIETKDVKSFISGLKSFIEMAGLSDVDTDEPVEFE